MLTAIKVLKRHLELLLERFNHFQELEARPDDLEDMFTPAWMRVRIDNIVAQGAAHLTQVRLHTLKYRPRF